MRSRHERAVAVLDRDDRPTTGGATSDPPKQADGHRRREAGGTAARDASGGTCPGVRMPGDTPFDARRPRARPELLPAGGLLAVASVMAAGAGEHGDRWRTRPARHHVGAALRHVLRWCVGEPYDADLQAQGHGQHSHLACAGARVLMALDLVEHENDTKERP